MSIPTLSGPLGLESVFPPKVSSHQLLSSSPSSGFFFSPSFCSTFSTLGLQCSKFIRPLPLSLICSSSSRKKSIEKGSWRITALYRCLGPYRTIVSSCRDSPDKELSGSPYVTSAQAEASLYRSLRAWLPCRSSISFCCRLSSSMVTLATPDLRNATLTGN